MKEIITAGRRLVIVGSRPQDLDGVAPRICRDCRGALVADIKRRDFELASIIIEAKWALCRASKCAQSRRFSR